MKIKSGVLASVLLGIVFTVFSCNKKEANATTNTIKKEYSGEELFRGIFFVEGEVAHKINFFEVSYEHLESLPEDKKLAYRQYVDVVVNTIDSEYPTLFSELQTIVQSKNLSKIEKIYQDTREKVEELMAREQNQEYEIIKADFEQSFTILACSKRIGKGCIVYSWGKNGLDVLTKLQQDLLIEQISQIYE